MELRFKDIPIIDNVRRYPGEIVEGLRALLAHGAPAVPDVHRRGFFDIEGGKRAYYIHVCPNGNVLLLASWSKQGETTYPPSEALAAGVHN